MEWWRSWHGAPMDPKWLLIAKIAEVPAGVVSAIAWAMFDHASQNSIRGDVSKFDVETYSVYSGFGEMQVRAVIAAMKDKKFIENGVLSGWAKRQPQREDGSAERAKAYRERNRTQTNANDHRTEQRREEKITPIPPSPSARVLDEIQAEKLSAGFERLWEAWSPYDMVKGNKAQAKKSYVKARNSGVALNVIGPAAVRYCEICHRRKIKTQYLATWLNQKGWEGVEDDGGEEPYDPYNPRHAII